ncbi:MAG TPA: Ppx/GppA phosphatase family protein [Brevibacterium sp.]|nr:Ppx/GppA phosphatase family protein [Brevibacterium sp.]HLS33177.1 Ppx/GppA phosphatase family protein [Brevibacterium sp.]
MTRTAAFDCGTNSLRLLVADVDDAGRLTDLAREMRVVRLGQGVDRTGEFAPEALARTFAACDEYAEIVSRLAPDRLRFVATSASRDVSNRDAFAAGVQERLGILPEVIDGDEEAELSFLGATAGVPDAASPRLVMDLGGGSTELVLGDATASDAYSMNIGCVRLFERHLASDPPTAEQVAALRADVDDAFIEAAQHVDVSATRTLVGVAGTITTVAAAVLDLPGYDREAIHGASLTRAQITRTADRLTAMPSESRRTLPYMHPGRADVIAAGSHVYARLVELIDEAVGRSGGTLDIRVSESDILDGIALGLARD